MKRQYDMRSILSFFNERPGGRRAVGPTPRGEGDNDAFDEWLDARLRELYADVVAEELPADLVEAVKKAHR
jgi:hypothetical protein